MKWFFVDSYIVCIAAFSDTIALSIVEVVDRLLVQFWEETSYVATACSSRLERKL